jgi:aminoglycoside phosphotransferase (APT) family kinase protein
VTQKSSGSSNATSGPTRAATDAADERVLRATLDTTRDRDAAMVASRLRDWLEARQPGARVVRVEPPSQSGASSELYFVEIAGLIVDNELVEQAVLKLSPAYAVYPFVDLRTQWLAMDLVRRRSSAPVPRVYACEMDPGVLGVPFLLMERRYGRGAPDWPSYVREGWIRDLSPDERTTLWLRGLEVVAAVHQTELAGESSVELRLPTPGTTLLDQSLAYWRRYLELVSAGGDYPVLVTAVEHLERERPSLELAPRLVWGDASLRNMLFSGLEPCTILDFEFAHVGLYPFDVAFYAMMDHVMAEGFAQSPRLSGFLGIQQTLDRYEDLTGWPVPERDYFLRMAVTYMSLATTRVFQRLARDGRVPAETVAANPPLMILEQIVRTGRLPG